jgi:hypothetical protein
MGKPAPAVLEELAAAPPLPLALLEPVADVPPAAPPAIVVDAGGAALANGTAEAEDTPLKAGDPAVAPAAGEAVAFPGFKTLCPVRI